MSQLRAIQDRLLENVSNGLFAKDFTYISESLFPQIPVKETTGKLAKYGTAHLRIVHDLAGGRAEARRVEPVLRDTDGYSLEKHSLEGMVTAEDYANVQKPFRAEEDETIGVTTMILNGKEKALADILGSTSYMTSNTTLSGTGQFSDLQNSDPLGVSDDAAAAMIAASGVSPNVAVVPLLVRNKLRFHPQILESLGFKYDKAGKLTDQNIAEALGVSKIYVPNAIYDSSVEGQAASLTQIWGKNILFAYLPEVAAPYQKSLGYYILKEGVGSRKVYKYPINNPANATGILIEDWYDYVLSDVNCAYLVKNAIA